MRNDLSQWRLEKAEKTFTEGNQLLGCNSFSGAVNRFYYAAFHAVRALLATKELDSAKHSGVISLFNREFVKTGKISKQSGRVFSTVFNLRSDADYDDFSEFTQDQVTEVKQSVRLLIDEINTYLRKEMENI